jgi:thermostable 8-oxoguanine DNA glycosylase
MKVIDFTGDLNQFLKEYNYQPAVTERLDDLGNAPLNQEILNEIVLWKVIRYVFLDSPQMESLERLRDLNLGEHRKADLTIRSLLNCRGVDLPMASTFMRFRNPRVFQIIDRHAYRAITDERHPLYPSSSPNQKVSVYFDYLDRVIALCEKRNIRFETVDRLLYIFDKRKNGKL